jgi:hypothetical protein
MSESNSQTQAVVPKILWVADRPAVWQLEQGPVCLALFSTTASANEYAARCLSQPSQIQELEPQAFSELLVSCWRADVHWAVLDPQNGFAKKLFDLRLVLKRIQSELRNGRALNFFIQP